MFERSHSGEGYRHYIKDIVEKRFARSYLEIGVRDGEMLSMINIPSIGVDPEFHINFPIARGKRQLFLFQMTSDEFFRDYDPRLLLGVPIDAVFLDGLHQFEYLLRDFMNAERVCHNRSMIFLDDCLPLNSEMTQRVFDPDNRQDLKTARIWTGDVWKVVPILKKYRPDLHLIFSDTQPTGNVAVTNLDNSSTVLRDKYFDIVKEFYQISSDEKNLTEYFETLEIISTHSVLTNLELSVFFGF